MPAGGCNGIRPERFHLADFGLFAVSALCPRDRDIDLGDIRDRLRPRIRHRLLRPGQLFARSVSPPLAEELSEYGGRLAVHEHLHVMERRVVFFPGVCSAGVVGKMLRGVPAYVGEVDAAVESDAVVDNNDLLMMRCPGGQVFIQAEMDPLTRFPPEFPCGQRLALEGVEGREVPDEDIDVEVRFYPHGIVQEFSEMDREVGLVVTAEKLELAVDIPAGDVDASLCFQNGFDKGLKICLGVDDERNTVSFAFLPVIPALLIYRPSRFHGILV